jgi:hypothetical protein
MEPSAKAKPPIVPKKHPAIIPLTSASGPKTLLTISPPWAPPKNPATILPKTNKILFTVISLIEV